MHYEYVKTNIGFFLSFHNLFNQYIICIKLLNNNIIYIAVFESHSGNTTLCDKILFNLRQVDDFLRVLRFLPPIKLTATI